MVARKSSVTPTNIWSYEARGPVSNAALVHQICQRASSYYDQLIEIERQRIQEYRETRRHYAPKLVELEQALEDARASTAPDADSRQAEAKAALQLETLSIELEMRPAREAYEDRTSGAPRELLERRRQVRAEWQEAKLTRGNPQTKPLKAELERLGAEIRKHAAPPRLKEKINERVLAEMLEEEWPDVWKDLMQADNSAREQRIAARRDCGIPPGCYLLVEKSVEQAIAARRPLSPLRKERHFNWRIGVQLTPDIAASELHQQGNTRVRWSVSKGGYGSVWLRVGSEEGSKSPVWAEFPVRIHRMPPPSARVKWAWISIRERAGSLHYELQLSQEDASFARKAPESGVVTVEMVAPRQRRDGAWVLAEWRGDDGALGELLLPGADASAQYEDGASWRRQRRVRKRRLGLEARLAYPDKVRATIEGHREYAYRLLRRVLRLDGQPTTGWRRGDAMTIRQLCQDWACHVLGAGDWTVTREMWRAWRSERDRNGLDYYAALPEASRWAAARGWDARQRLAWWAELWSRKYAHLTRLADACSRSSRNARGEEFASQARALAARYRDLRITKESLVPTNGTEGAQRRVLGPGELREALVEEFSAEFTTTARAAEIRPDSSVGGAQSTSEQVPGAA